uniref:Uncharacterized protein n=1 Tax=Caenorhabditis japonica TaxID=281687 RepID=A0A8R1ERS6_CAEJA
MASSSNYTVPMIDLASSTSSGDDEELDVVMMRSYMPLPIPSIRTSFECCPPDTNSPDSPFFGNGNMCRSTLSLNPTPFAPSPFSDITVSSQHPLVKRSESNASEQATAIEKKKPVPDIAHVSLFFLVEIWP